MDHCLPVNWFLLVCNEIRSWPQCTLILSLNTLFSSADIFPSKASLMKEAVF